MACYRFRVTGRVQGVFYRASTEDTARELGLSGWVRNCADGSVELVACGEEQTLKRLEHWLWDGPQLARVSNVEVQVLADEVGDFTGFTVRY